MQPQKSSGNVERAVGIQLNWSAATEIYAPAWSGVVQAVPVEPRQILRSGDVVATIDGVDRIAFHSPTPFFRSLSRGDTGEDVRALNALLADGQFDHGDSDIYSWSTARGVREFAKTIGAPSGPFSPEWVVFLPSSEVSIETVSLRTGAPAPLAGETVMESKRQLIAARLVDAASAPSPSGEDNQAENPPLPGIKAEPDETLIVGTVELGLTDARDTITPESGEELVNIVENLAPFTSGVLSRPVPADQLTIPVGAIITEFDGRQCVLRATETDEGGRTTASEAVEVTVLASDAGLAWVGGRLSEADRVSVSPRQIERSCS